MTGIIIDKFGKDKLYIFSDGRETCGDSIHTNTARKIRDYEAGGFHYHFICTGDVSAIAYYSNKIITAPSVPNYIKWIFETNHPEQINSLDFSLHTIIQDLETKKIVIIETSKFEKKSCFGHIGVSEILLEELPIFLGSGGVALHASYNVLELCQDSLENKLTEKEYLNFIKYSYLAASAVISSMGTLHQTVCIRYRK